MAEHDRRPAPQERQAKSVSRSAPHRSATLEPPGAARLAGYSALLNRERAAPRPGQKPARNTTGLPDRLKAGVEALSGVSLDDVRVHYNSARPSAVGAYAYAQGRDIHVAPGQERHLPHEAWHVAQQAQGRVAATRLLASGQKVNDEPALEREADRMGAKALSHGGRGAAAKPRAAPLRAPSSEGATCQRALAKGKLNVAGEDHGESGQRRPAEREFAAEKLGKNSDYWTESGFRYTKRSYLVVTSELAGDPKLLRIHRAIAHMREFQDRLDGLPTAEAVEIAKKQMMAVLATIHGDASQASTDDLPAEARHAYASEAVKMNNYLKAIKLPDQGATAPSAAAAAEVAAISRRIGELEKLAKIDYKNAGAKNFAAGVNLQRSQAMYDAAVAKANAAGVWKVGDSHVGDISKMKPAAFGLVTRQQFNAEFDAWREPAQKAGDKKDQKGGEPPKAAAASSSAAAAPASASASASAASASPTPTPTASPAAASTNAPAAAAAQK